MESRLLGARGLALRILMVRYFYSCAIINRVLAINGVCNGGKLWWGTEEGSRFDGISAARGP
jgi:hypothetical protein